MISSWLFHDAWLQLLVEILGKQTLVKPRDLLTKELFGAQLLVGDYLNNVLVHPVRNVNYKFMVAEWLWMHSGSDDVETISRYNKAKLLLNTSDDGKTFAGAYGPRLVEQLPWAIELLNQSPDTRQAVVSIWRECPRPSKDIPCTVSLQFLVRQGTLNLIATMRSSDAWIGLPYDVYNFSMIANYVNSHLKLRSGNLLIQMGSSHLYERDWEKAHQALDRGPESRTVTSRKMLRPLSPVEAKSALDNSSLEFSIYPYTDVLRSVNNKEALGVLDDAASEP